jgi:phosphohistidine phosphatase
MFGHNPEITMLASEFVPVFAEHVPTAGCVAIDFDIDNWVDIESGKGKLRFFEYPKKHK